jgi:excisionase family DNA binding protein
VHSQDNLNLQGEATDTTLGGNCQVERKTISIMKACELVGVSRRTIYNWLSSGKIEYVRTAGGSVRIFVDTLWRDPNNAERPAVQATWQAEGRN